MNSIKAFLEKWNPPTITREPFSHWCPEVHRMLAGKVGMSTVSIEPPPELHWTFFLGGGMQNHNMRCKIRRTKQWPLLAKDQPYTNPNKHPNFAFTSKKILNNSKTPCLMRQFAAHQVGPPASKESPSQTGLSQLGWASPFASGCPATEKHNISIFIFGIFHSVVPSPHLEPTSLRMLTSWQFQMVEIMPLQKSSMFFTLGALARKWWMQSFAQHFQLFSAESLVWQDKGTKGPPKLRTVGLWPSKR